MAVFLERFVIGIHMVFLFVTNRVAMSGVLDLLRVEVSDRCCIMKFLHRSIACCPSTMFFVNGSIIESLAGLRVRVSENGSCMSRCVEECVLFGLNCVGMCFVWVIARRHAN